jgi:cytochrome c553
MKVLSLAALILVSVACNNAAPTATAYKEQLGAPAAVTGNNNSTPAGDAAKGQTALATCTGCHAEGGAAHVLVASDADSIGKGDAGKNPIHSSVPQAAKDAFTNNSLDMAAFLKGGSTGGTASGGGDAAKGNALITGACAACHGASASDLDSFSNLETAVGATFASHTPEVKKMITDNKADLEAALKAL